MLAHRIRSRHGGRAEARRDAPLLLAVFSYRYDAHLVPDLLQNLEPVVDGWVAFDDRGSEELYSSEPARRLALITRARELGAEWVLGIDPDERLERGVADAIREMTRAPGAVAWGFRLRELYAPDAYRVDGVWGRKEQFRLFPVRAAQRFTEQAFHGRWIPVDPKPALRRTALNLYHLKMIAPARRRARRDLYHHVDPGRAYQAIGYDYLADETGLVLETIPPERSYDPPHTDDGGLWMAPTPDRRDDPVAP